MTRTYLSPRVPPPSRYLLAVPLLALHLGAGPALARTIPVTPADDFRAIEAARAGDIVEIAPGTYRFRVSLEAGGTAAQPIVIRAKDPLNRPVWDLTGTPVGSAPGSYQAGDKGRGCWQVRAGHYHIQGIVFRGCVDVDSAGLRVVNVPDVTITSCLFQDSTHGVTGAGDDLRIAFSEFDGDGLVMGKAVPGHSLYVYGGTLDVRYSYFHDSPRGQHFHVRSRDAVLAYNWFTRPGSYTGDLMPCEHFCGGAAGQPITQRMLLLGNVIVQGTPTNGTKLLTLFKDENGGAVDGTGNVNAMELTLINNTLIGTARPMGAVNDAVQMRNDTITTTVHASNNVAVGFSAFAAPVQPGNYGIDGAANWMTTGTTAMGLSGSRFGKDPGLSAAYVPQPGSPILGTAAAPAPLPTFEYYRDEKLALMGRARASVKDPGAFESTTASAPFGADDPGPGGADLGGGSFEGDGGGGGDDGAIALPGEPPPAGCAGCAAAPGPSGLAVTGWGLLLGLSLLLRRRRAGQYTQGS